MSGFEVENLDKTLDECFEEIQENSETRKNDFDDQVCELIDDDNNVDDGEINDED